MIAREVHPSDAELLLVAAREGAGEASAHVAACSTCGVRMRELELRLEQTSAQLRATAEASVPGDSRASYVLQLGWLVGAAFALALTVLGGWFAFQSQSVAYAEAPDPARTPGAVRQDFSIGAACIAGPDDGAGPMVPQARAMLVFRRYEINRPEPRQFELDYLIPPDLGGTDDPDNLWPQPYNAGVWNSRVKDALEDRLRAMVCNGEIDLTTAQQELSRDWIAAYKKMFRTEQPLMDHAGFVKDRAWE